MLPPKACFIEVDEFLEKVNHYDRIDFFSEPISKKNAINFNMGVAPNFPANRQKEKPFELLVEYIHSKDVLQRFLFIVESAGRREILLNLLQLHDIAPTIHSSWASFLEDKSRFNILIGPLVTGSELTELGISIIVESQLFKDQITPQRKSSQKVVDPDIVIRDLVELQVGNPVVHLEFGVGRYEGLEYIDNQGQANEFLVLRYAHDDKIYVPITSLNVISRYTGSAPEHAPLHRLGTDQWQKEKKQALTKIHDVAVELLDTYAKRESKEGHTYTIDPREYDKFASGFLFTETSDQLKAIQEIIGDLTSPRPMDRLICGDVGFGKTEVAMRAAFIAVNNNKQVCVLVPTTLLAGQHFETFRDRFADFPIRIDLLSRFRSNKESEQVLKDLKEGKIDIIIGTHKLFQKNVSFKDLGLLIIDEEHRFGVRQKEYIKTLRNQIDMLSMTATPIPRTLNMAMTGIRDISLIATPPAKRLAIKTFLAGKK